MLFGIFRPFQEIYYGFAYKYIPQDRLLIASCVMSLILVSRIDLWIFYFLGFKLMYPYHEFSYWAYYAFLCVLPFLLWGIGKSLQTLKMARQLERAFQVANLINNLKRVPSLISDLPIDSATKKLRLTSAYLPLARFQDAKPYLESALHVYIDRIKETIDRGTIEIVYSPFPMPSMVKYKKSEIDGRTQFWIGDTRSGKKLGDFKDTPHLLIAGQTGGGKSTFVRQLIASLYLNDEHAQFCLMDLKGGLEANMFEGFNRIRVAFELAPSVQELAQLEKIIKMRMQIYKEESCKDIEEYQKKFFRQELQSTKLKASSAMNRYYVVIDEAAEMFLAGQSRKSDDVLLARRVVSLIARQGRSVGIHLMIATQRPDSKALDPQVKANLTGVLCFAIANDASSITVLGNGRATDLPDIKGRAIWKNGMELIEVQTPFLSTDDFIKLMHPPKEADAT